MEIVYLMVVIIAPAISAFTAVKVGLNGLERRVTRIEKILDFILSHAMQHED